ncbi:MAG: hypothetical protein OEY51_10225, partial [Cyclobacteriaceae bacterium]|nr:hypothetical protein [Cyclobacteriaceae bacterium]
LKGKDLKNVEDYLHNNPKAMEELEDLRHVRQTLQGFEDREVMEPNIIFQAKTRGFFLSHFVKKAMTIAAAIILIMVTAYWMELKVSYSNEGFYLGFHEGVQAEKSDQAEMKEMINTAMAGMSNQIDNRFAGLESRLDDKIGIVREENEQDLSDVLKKATFVSQEQIREYVDQMNQENKKAIQALFELNKEEQQEYMKTMLTDFNDYIEKRREADLEMIDLYVTQLKQDTEVKQLETDQILASIINQVSNTETVELR